MSSSGARQPPGSAEPSAPGSGPAAAVRRPRRWPRRLLWSVLAVVVALALVFFAGGGWYFAGQIRSEALAVEPGTALPAYTDARVVGVAPGLIRLRAIGSQPALFRPELDGIAWRGGIGRLGASVAVSGGVVTRPLTVVSGSPPRAGQLAGLDTSYFLGDPAAALGIPVQDVAVRGPLGPLPAWYFPGRGSTFVIGVHGRNSTRNSLLRIVSIVHGMRFPALDVTYRNDLGVAHDPSGYLRYGETEWRDLQATVAYGASQRSLPVTGGSIPAPLVWTAETIASGRFGVDWSATDYLSDASWLKAPALVFHGTDDTTVPISTSIRLKQLRPALVTLARFPGAGHVESWNIGRARYTSLLESFLSPVAP